MTFPRLYLTNGQAHEIRVTVDWASNEAKFYIDGTLRSTVAANGDAGMGAGTTALEIGSVLTGTAVLLDGDIYWVQIYDGIDGTLVFDMNLADAEEPFATFTERSAKLRR